MDVDDASLELVDEFCYLGIDRDAEAAVEARKGWNKFRQLTPLLIVKDVSLLTSWKLYRG